MVKFHSFKPCSVLLLGDLLLDAYTMGEVRRISPEAPVPVVEVLDRKSCPGGAGNVALNLKALQASVFILARVGADAEGEILQAKLEEAGIDISPIVIEKGYRTPIKNRIIAGNQQLLRLDFETIVQIQKSYEDLVLEKLPSLIRQVQIVVISDYGKGFLSDTILAKAIEIANAYGVPSIVDPKGTNFKKYEGATIIKPNLSEAIHAAKMPPKTSLDLIAQVLFRDCKSKHLLITRSEEGMSLFHQNGTRNDFPVSSKQVRDVTGAGDTVLAMMSVAMANGADLSLAVQMANIAAGIAIEQVGCVQVTLPEIAEKILSTQTKTKILDDQQLLIFKQVFQAQPYQVLRLQKTQLISHKLLATLKILTERKDCALAVYIPSGLKKDPLVELLTSLHDVKTVILEEKNLNQLTDSAPPQETFTFENEILVTQS
jgi:D-beta-D-heptose 7-phosphate kinase/D-beta-D-heptose 1-phosphate adenosyltransferase